MSTVDVNRLDGQGIVALIMAAVRAERFCDGALKEFFENGSIKLCAFSSNEMVEAKRVFDSFFLINYLDVGR